MSDSEDSVLRLEQRFAKAVDVLHSLGPDEHQMVPSTSEKLEFYGLYKQATLGPCTTARPSVFDVAGRAKHDAWQRVSNMSQSDAKENYVDAVIKFLERFPDRPVAAEMIDYFERSRAGIAMSDTDSEANFSERELSDYENEHEDEHLDETHYEVPVDTLPHYEEKDKSATRQENSGAPSADQFLTGATSSSPVRALALAPQHEVAGPSASQTDTRAPLVEALVERVRGAEAGIRSLRTEFLQQSKLLIPTRDARRSFIRMLLTFSVVGEFA
ncbi:acyl CoA binding protein-domain-containing protein [Gaertneriomyces semiglobifer]|nr:acyl CoA binding protein-domain-containing protein [Gaertneriomyces semiglobifer]